MKPSPYFLQAAARQYDIDLSVSFFIGDHPHDVETGKRAGTNTVYVLSGHGAKHRAELDIIPDLIAKDLYEASARILETSQKGAAG
jgi:D-glycero-D-manno-heptose 1,7-bisphosphate phosphatase